MGKGEITSTSTVKQIRPQTDTLARAELLFVCNWLHYYVALNG